MKIAGADAGELAQTYGTPLLVIDVDAVDAAIATFLAACEPFDVEVSYAAKAFVCIEFARRLAAHGGIGLDVCSLGELRTAERAAFAPGRLTLHGAGKSDDELRAAIGGRVGFIAVDSVEELERLSFDCARFARSAQDDIAVLLRINTRIEAHTHAFVRTGGDDTKFGIAKRDEERAAALLGANPQLRFAGLHSHAGSQIYEPDAFAANATALVESAARFGRYGLNAERIVVGGGFGVQMQPDAQGEALDVAATIADIVRATRRRADELGIAVPRIGIEPGRAIVASAGTTLYRVVAIKPQTARTFVVVDGGIYENPRPALYGAYHHVVAVAPHGGELREVTLCGRSCENDELGKAALPVDLKYGDLLAMHATGAYTYSMAGNYNRFPRPAVVAVQGGEHRLWIRRETLDDVLQRDVGV